MDHTDDRGRVTVTAEANELSSVLAGCGPVAALGAARLPLSHSRPMVQAPASYAENEFRACHFKPRPRLDEMGLFVETLFLGRSPAQHQRQQRIAGNHT